MADKKKRKSLMETLSDYQKEKGYGPKKKSNTKTAFGSKQMLKVDPVRPVLKAPPAVKPSKPAASKPAPKPAASTPAPKPAASTPARARQQTQVTRSNRNKTDAGGMRYTGGRGGTPTVSTPAPNRKPKPGTGRTGAAAAKAANRTSGPKAKPLTAAQRRAMRLRARRGR